MTGSLSIVVADIDVLVTEFLASALAQHGHRVHVAPPVHTAVHDWVRAFDVDVCLTDLTLRDGTDVAHVARLTKDFPTTRVVVRTANASSEVMRAALAAGASGYLHKSRGLGMLLELLARVAEGEIVVEGSFARPTGSEPAQAELRGLIDSLTPRQRECLAMIAEGKGTVAMAHQLGVSALTVRSHVQAVLGKLGARSRLEAAAMAIRYRYDAPIGPDAAVPVAHGVE